MTGAPVRQRLKRGLPKRFAQMPTLAAVCWCEKLEIQIPVEWVSEGRTASCGSPRCRPGCTTANHPEYDPYDDVPTPHRRIKMNRFRPDQYDPIRDSSDQFRTGPLRDDHRTDLILATGPNLCPCGCTEPPRSKGSTFGMGHDIRLRGKLIRAEAAGAKVVLVTVDGAAVTASRVEDPVEFASFYSTELLDWSAAVRSGAKRITDRADAAKVKKANKLAAEREVLDSAIRDVDGSPVKGKEETIKVGRWEYTGSVVAVKRSADGTETVYEYVTKGGEKRRAIKDADGVFRAA